MKKVVVISGGSSGLGKATAVRLAKECQVVILARHEDKLHAVAEKIGCDYMVCDITNSSDTEKTVKNIISKYRTIDYLINNAGMYISGLLEENEPETIHKVLETNVLGAIYLTRAVIPHMKATKQGLIINVVSTAGISDKASGSVYHASKFAAHGFTRSIGLELKPYGIRVAGIYPGAFEEQESDDSGTLDVEEVVNGIEFILKTSPSTIVPQLVIKHVNFHS